MRELIVAGAGPVGLSAALAARSQGLPALVLEARDHRARRPGSRAIFVHRATLELLDRISPGLGGEVASRGLVWDTRRTLWAGREVYARAYRAPAAGAPFTSLPQTVVEDLLRRACEAAGVEFGWADPVREVAVAEDGVRLVTASGAAHEARHVIAADGARSVVRERLGIALAGTASATEFVVVDVADGPSPLPAERVFHYRHPAVGGRNVLLVPFRGGWRVDVQCRPGDDAQGFAASAADWLPDVLPGIRRPRPVWSSVYRFQQRVAERFTDPFHRVLLAGEAAHLLPPFGARGMNSGIADAVEAARAVRARGASPAAPGDPVAGYAVARRAAAERNVRAAGAALDHLAAPRLRQRWTQRAAATAAPLWPRAARWLDSAPYGPRLRQVRY
ncbi:MULTISPECIES: FAD-dependent monooxygenase [Streptomycetaceae]|uniref:Monooxygenase FAD-binding protein n=1 Tax=Streptantibioticus cattleyicolor (strain ATCC 35852 / DSM 46488 / JCM 4925 / NBRC 14057 / NRRL 8057) TaxID=1003195 RepID=F8JQK6_STREN|nr:MULTISPECIES: FAD-dependent monooxygenase [Streptomycetaceae]AEW97853.1 monooxygenase FAD-binding protein [Streptantibioticus cattleyicolor NRRL 8057 = DSM 46488]MYS62267.1 monooxygenase [Streptomyces sp. SID5468]CCB78172.1 Monooxygenase FAD-binding [Streptantibioticus cattleyicolor NRRL 8057 = DSM 46488]